MHQSLGYTFWGSGLGGCNYGHSFHRPAPAFDSSSGHRTSNTSILTICLLITALAVLATTRAHGKPSGEVYDLGGIPIITAWSFFTERYDFLRRHLKDSGRTMFRFRVLQHRVFAGAGEEYRKVFFAQGGLSTEEGYNLLTGSFPTLEVMDGRGADADMASGLVKRLLLLTRKDRMAETLPVLLEDVDRKVKRWGTEGSIDPFKEVHELVFQMTVRMATCRELAEDDGMVQKVADHFWDIEKSSTPAAVLLPWFPGPARRKGKQATVGLYNLLNSYVDLRRKAAVPSLDLLDVFIGDGTPNNVIVGTVMGIIFVGVVNTGVNSCWALLYLGTNPVWKQKAIDEFKALVSKHTNTLSSEPLHKRLSAVPLSAWEEELPSLEFIIRETLRLTKCTTALRRNLGNDVAVGGHVVRRGDFMAYSLADTHLDPEIYSEPLKFNPDRYLEGNEEDKKATFAFIGWGIGRHPCPGVKVAKLEIKIILALVLLGYEYELVDKSGEYPKSLPQPDRNDIFQTRPLGEPCYLKFKRVVE